MTKIMTYAVSAVVTLAVSLPPYNPISLSGVPEPSTTPMVSAISLPGESVRLNYVAQELVNAGYDTESITTLLQDSRKQLLPVRSVAYKKVTEKQWSDIRRKLYSASFVRQGKNYIEAHRSSFEQAQRDSEVPMEVIAGIIAIETEFGKNSGTTSTFNAVYSRMEQWPEEKWKSQAKQVIALSKHCLNTKQDCFAIKGSYAGAMGLVQFMPDSLLAFGIDGDHDGDIDLKDPVDAILSAGNYLKMNGWGKSPTKALTTYYGSPEGYPEIVLHYASLLTK